MLDSPDKPEAAGIESFSGTVRPAEENELSVRPVDVEAELARMSPAMEQFARELAAVMAGAIAKTVDNVVSEAVEQVVRDTESVMARMVQDLENKLSRSWREVSQDFTMATEARFAAIQIELKKQSELLDRQTEERRQGFWKRFGRRSN